ncbi:co-chaperone GroES [Patescibacteria group bacterium]
MKKQKITPVGERVLVEALSEEERMKKTSSGIVIPDTVGKEKIDRGTVIAVGTGKIVKKGNMVLFSEYNSEKIKVDDKEYYIVSEENILAVIE